MMVSISFFGMQRTVTKRDSMDMHISERTRLIDALNRVRELYPELHLEDGMIISTVNHESAQADRLLKPGDLISFLPHIGGG